MARIKIEDLPVEATNQNGSPNVEDLRAVEGGMRMGMSQSYFQSKPQSFGQTSPQLPLPGGSLVPMPSLSGVRG